MNFGNPGDLSAERRDPAANIRANFGRVLGELGCAGREVVEVWQVHGAGVHRVLAGTASHAGEHDTRADAIVSDDPGRLLAVRVADCAPVLLASGDGRWVAAVHAGWRGAVAGIAGKTVAELRGLGATGLSAVVGPCIGPGAFEVGGDVAEAFAERVGWSGFVRPIEGRTGKWWCDLGGALRRELEESGVERVEVLGRCTVTDRFGDGSAVFFSHRRDGGLTGRMIGIIGAADGILRG